MQNTLILCGSRAPATGGEERIKNEREEGSRTEYCVKCGQSNRREREAEGYNRREAHAQGRGVGGGGRERENSREYG
jgi:Zn ribbon nucleic-acid-binding protein